MHNSIYFVILILYFCEFWWFVTYDPNRRLSSSTVRRRLRSLGLNSRRPFRGNNLTAVRRQNRLQWTRRHQRWLQRQWTQVVFTDESRFHLSGYDGRIRIWRRRGERYANCCVHEADRWGGGSVMVWGGISFRHRTPLIIIDGTLTSQRYINEVLRPTVVPFLAAHHDVTLFQQDNARPHSARATMDFLQQQNIATLPWPAFSPDLSPIEHLWDQLGRAVRQRHPQPQTRRQLKAALQAEWRNIPQVRIQRLIRSMPRRCRACVAVVGGHIRYWFVNFDFDRCHSLHNFCQLNVLTCHFKRNILMCYIPLKIIMSLLNKKCISDKIY